MKLVIKLSDGTLHDIEADSSITVADLKNILAEPSGLPANQQV